MLYYPYPLLTVTLAPLKSSPLIEPDKAALRASVPFYDEDRYFAPDIEKAIQLLKYPGLAELLH